MFSYVLFLHRKATTGNLRDGTWHFICLTWTKTGGVAKFYVDGKDIATRNVFAGDHLKVFTETCEFQGTVQTLS